MTKRSAPFLALAVAILAARIVQAHADYARSEPGAGAIVAAAPTQIEIWFTQDMFRRAGENWIRVTAPDGAEVQASEAQVDDDDRRLLRVALAPDLAPGEYTVTYRTLSSEDGDDFEGSFTFTFDPQAQVTSTPMSAAPTPTDLPATPTPVAAVPTPTPTPAPAGGLGCGASLAPLVGLVSLGLGARWKRRRS